MLALTAHQGLAQITTASMTGTIFDGKSTNGLPGASVVAIHLPSGTKYGAVTNFDGEFRLLGLKAGGPYEITVSFVGYRSQVRKDIELTLGNEFELNVNLLEESTQLEEVVVTGERNPVFDEGRTGASTTISTRQIQNMPTISRSLTDFVRLTPQFSSQNGGLSFAGQNNRFNNVTIDGAVNNDVFGLSQGGTPGSRQGAQPVSIDAIQELQVVIAPFDVRQSGFTGGGVNAVTRSGSNKVEGSVYGFFRNQNMVGRRVKDSTINVLDYTKYQTGFRVGGPLIKDKLFYFFNYELDVLEEPTTYFVENGAFRAGPRIDYRNEVPQLQQMREYLIGQFGYDPGDPTNNKNFLTRNDKIFVRFDWNINQKHKLMVRHSFTGAATNEVFRSATTYSFNNSGYSLDFNQNNTIIELQSRFSNTFSNEFRVSFNRLRDESTSFGRDFPSIRMRLPSNSLASTGLDRNRGANSLSQDLIEITNNSTLLKGKHTITFGTRNEIYTFNNLFIQSFAGEWEFANYDSLVRGMPTSFLKVYSTTGNPRESVQWSAAQFGLYAQDEFKPIKDLKLTVGIRADLPMMLGSVPYNALFAQQFRLDNSIAPTARILWSPRVGFNWNVKGEKKTQIRGGAGLFTGRPPFVWLSNQYSNAGVQFATARLSIDQLRPLFPVDPFTGRPDLTVRNGIIGNPGFTPEGNAGIQRVVDMNISNPNLRLPQVMRANLALDQKLPWGMIGTIELLYTRVVNDIYMRNIGINPTPVRIIANEQRPVFGTLPSQPATPPVAVPNYVDPANFNNVYVLENTSRGYQWSSTFQLEKNVGNTFFSRVAYTYGQAKDISSLENSTAGSNFSGTPIGNDFNSPGLAFSDFDQRHRLIAAAGYTFDKYSKMASTNVAIFYNAQNGGRSSYTVFGDVNGDGFSGNDLIYVPRNASEIVFSGSVAQQQAQWNAFNEFIEGTPSLRNRRGQLAERNGIINPWYHQIDARVMQNVHFMTGERKHTLQLAVDVFNLGNLLYSEWGVRRFNNTARFLTLNNFDTAGNPIYTFDPNFQRELVSYTLSSTWQMQVSARYIF